MSMRLCKCCLKEKPEAAFMVAPAKHCRVTYCIDCARLNMAAWAKTVAANPNIAGALAGMKA